MSRVKVDHPDIQRALDEIDIQNRKEFVRAANLSKFSIDNFGEKEELYEFDVNTADIATLRRIVATMLKKMR